MKAQTRHVSSVPPLSVADEELRELEARCSEIKSRGGEAGAIASEIMRISKKLKALTDEADRFLHRLR